MQKVLLSNMGPIKRVPAWSLVLVVLAATGLIVFVVTPIGGSLFGPANRQDFALSSSPASLTIIAGYSDTISLTLTSVNGFDGNVSLTATVAPGTNGPSVALRSTVMVSSGGSAVVSGTISTTNSTPGNYTITIQGKTTALSHSVLVSLRVTPAPPPPPPDFAITVSPASLNAFGGSTIYSAITVYSISGYFGNVTFSVSITPLGSGANASIAPGAVSLSSGGSATSTLTVRTNATGTYMITVTGTSGSHNHGFQIPLTVGAFVGREALNLEVSGFSSGTNATLDLRNTGTTSVSLISYYVRDASGNQYSLTAWSGPVIPVNGLGIAKILIGSSCPNCVLTGTAFTFTAGNSYTIEIVTSRNNQFIFTVVR